MHNVVADDQELLGANARSVLESLMRSGPLSRADLARRLSLSAATLTKVVRPLVERGYCAEIVEEAPSTGGRPPRPIDIESNFAHFVGVKLTGAVAFYAVTDARGHVIREDEEPIEHTEPDLVADQLAARITAFRAGDQLISGVGVALSGTASRSSAIVRTSPFLHWKDVPLATMLSDRVGIPVVLENDVRAVTAAEQWFGAASELDSFVLITLGAGIGCGIVVNGSQVEGHLGASGLVGHLRVGDPGVLCYAGHPGCANGYATTDGIAKRLSFTHGRSLDFAESVELARQGDAAALAVFAEAGRAIGTILATVVNVLGPEKVFVSGEGVETFELGRDAALARMRELLHWTATEVDVESQPFGFTEWARGAAVVAVQSYIETLTTAPSAPTRSRAQRDRGAA